MRLPEGITSQLQSENVALRKMVTDLTQENLRLKAALSDALGVLNAARSRLEAANTQSIFSEPRKAESSINVNSTAEASPSVVGTFPFRNLDIRMLSDGTLEADTPEGPMRFEDIEHLDEVFAARWSRVDYSADGDITDLVRQDIER